jgi:predicted nucleic acid-binding protein
MANGYNCQFVATTPKLKVVKTDPDDNIFFECAVASKAAYIISGDKAVLAIKKYVTIEVLSPQAFLKLNLDF